MRRALGKGLAQLIGEQADAAPSEIPLEAIRPNSAQPRTSFDDQALAELAASIREAGILQPVVVRPMTEGTFELIAGERRWRAAHLAGLKTIPALVRSAGRQDALEWALIENLQREDIAPLECAQAYRRLADEFGLTQEEVADKVGKSRVSVTNTLRLLRLPPRIRQGLADGLISEGHARAILGAGGEPAQLALYDRILKRDLNVRQVEEAARGLSAKPSRARTRRSKRDPAWAALEEALSDRLGARAHFRSSGKGGEIVVSFYSDDDLDRILELLGVRL